MSGSPRWCRSWICPCGGGPGDAQGPCPSPCRPGLAGLVPLARSTPTRTTRAAGNATGWTVGPPHYVGVGAQKAGTSWWNRLIQSHPDVVNAGGQPKELHFFDRSWEVPFDDAAVEAYRRHFPVPEGSVAGEWTPGYLIDFWTPELIRRAAPDARILVLLRDPIERFRSGLTHQIGDVAEAPSDIGTSRVPSSVASTAPAAARPGGVPTRTGPRRASTKRVAPIRPGNWRGPTHSSAWPRSKSKPGPSPARSTPPHGTSTSYRRHSELRSSTATPKISRSCRMLVPELDLSLWPTAREIGLVSLEAEGQQDRVPVQPEVPDAGRR